MRATLPSVKDNKDILILKMLSTLHFVLIAILALFMFVGLPPLLNDIKMMSQFRPDSEQLYTMIIDVSIYGVLWLTALTALMIMAISLRKARNRVLCIITNSLVFSPLLFGVFFGGITALLKISSFQLAILVAIFTPSLLSLIMLYNPSVKQLFAEQRLR